MRKTIREKRQQVVKPQFTPPQAEFFDHQAKFLAYIGGIGSGKSFVGCARILLMPAGSRGMVVAPSYKTLKTATLKSFFEVLEKFGIPPEYVAYHNQTDGIMRLASGTEILWATGDNPANLRGPNLNFVYVDEAAFISEECWDILVGRIRGAMSPRCIWLTSTPNGKQSSWIWRRFVDKNSNNPKYHIVFSKTEENYYLPEDYIDDLRNSYSDKKAAQELDGQFIDLGFARVDPQWLRYSDPPAGAVAVGVDLASSTSKRADYTAAVAVVNGKHRSHVIDSTRHKLPFGESMDAICDFCVKNGAKIVYVEAVQYQMSAVQTLAKALRPHRIIVKPVRPTGNKLQRFLPVEAAIQQGLLTFSNGIQRDFTDELLGFTGLNDTHDDQVDALSYAFAGCSTKAGCSDVTDYSYVD